MVVRSMDYMEDIAVYKYWDFSTTNYYDMYYDYAFVWIIMI